MTYNYHTMIIKKPLVGVNIILGLPPRQRVLDDVRMGRGGAMLPDLRKWLECIRNKSNIMSQKTKIEVMERSIEDSETR